MSDILWLALRTCRPSGSPGIVELRDALQALAPGSSRVDPYGNLWIDRRIPGCRTLFMAHLDTVHKLKGIQDIAYNSEGLIYTPDGECLGADDGAGVAMLAELMLAGVPALYLFTLDEETGGRGADYIARFEGDRLSNLDRCISFDRKGTRELCGTQYIGPLASDQFIDALADALAMGHKHGTGTYTDSSEFSGIVPEIVNISIGYDKNHSPEETLDFNYWQALRNNCLSVDWESLPVIGPPPDPYRDSGDWRLSDYPMDHLEEADPLIDAEMQDLSDALGFPEGTWEYELILHALYRVSGIASPR